MGMTQLGDFLRLRLITAYWLFGALATTYNFSSCQAGDQFMKQAATPKCYVDYDTNLL